MKTLLLDVPGWDLTINVAGNIAVAEEPYAFAQDAASAIKLFEGELFFDTTQGIPYFEQILGHSPPLSLMKQYFNQQAMTVPGVIASRTFISQWKDRVVNGQVQILDESGTVIAAAGF